MQSANRVVGKSVIGEPVNHYHQIMALWLCKNFRRHCQHHCPTSAILDLFLSRNIGICYRTNKGETALFVIIKYFKSTIYSRGTTIHLYVVIVRSTITWGCAVLPLTSRDEQKQRTICRPVYDMCPITGEEE